MPRSKKLVKAQAPITVEPISLLPHYDEVLQKQNARRNSLETLYHAYHKNAWVNRAVNAIASSVIANGWKPQPLDVTAQPNPKAEAYLTQFLAQPNDRDSFEDVITLVVIDLLISGDSYWEVSRLKSGASANKTALDRFHNLLQKDSEYGLLIQDSIDASMQQLDGLPLALWHIDGRTMTKQTDEHGRITGYTQLTPDGKKVTFEPSQIMNFTLRGVEDEIYGASPLAPLEVDLVIDLYRQLYIKSQLENSTKLGNIITITDGPPEEIARVQEWMNIRARGPQHAGQNFVTNADTSITASAPAPYDTASDLADSLKEKIVCCLGIPLAKLGTADKGTLGDSTQDGANKTYIEVTVKPLARLIERQFNLHLIPDFQVVGVSGYGIAILTEDVDLISTQADMLVQLVNTGIFTRNEARVILKQVPFQNEGDIPIVMTSSGAMKLKDIEQNADQMAAVNAKLDALAGLVGGLKAEQANTDADSQTVAPPTPPGAPKPEAGPASPDIQKSLRALAKRLKKAVDA